MGAVKVEFTGDASKLTRDIVGLEKKVERLETKLSKVGKEGQKAGKKTGDALNKAGNEAGKTGKKFDRAFDPKKLVSFVGGLIGAGSVTAALAAVNRAYELSLKNLREISAEAVNASSQIISFTALQEGGTKAKRVLEVAAIAAEFGVADRGVAFDTAQALQSVLGGDFDKGLSATRTVFAASQVGIPVELGRELEIFGASQGAAPGDFLRKTFAAGQASGRDPEAVARAGPSLQFFDDKDLGFAVAGVIASSVRAEQVGTFVKAAGIGLRDNAGLESTFKNLGVLGSSRREKLQALADAGIDKPAELKEAGLGEVRQQQAVSTLVQNLSQLDRVRAEIIEKAQPGLLVAQRAAVERELPNTTTVRGIESLDVLLGNEKAFGINATKALDLELQEKKRGLAFRRMGKEQSGLFDLIDEEGRSTKVDEFKFRLIEDLQGDPKEVMHFESEMEKIDRELNKFGDRLNEVNGALERQSTATTGGPAMQSPRVDK